MKNKLTWFLIFVACAVADAAELRVSAKEPVVVTGVGEWTSAKQETPPGFPLEAYRLAPATNRNAVCMISIYAKDKPEFADPEFLKKVLRADSRPYVPSADQLAKIEIKELKINGGHAVYADFTDPDLAGKP